MAKINVAINGFGRIGRLAFRNLIEKENIEVVAINDLTDVATLAHLLKYDSIHGKFKKDVKHDDNSLIVGDRRIQISAEKDPNELPWDILNVDIVLESTGRFTDDKSAGAHINAGADKVVISAPAKGDLPTIVLGVNENILNGDEKIVSNASCTTNCLAPMAKILDDHLPG